MSSTQKTQNKKAGAFDIRNVIGALLGLYGLIPMLAYSFLDAGVNPKANEAKQPFYSLYAGIALIVVAVIFFVWAKICPTVTEETDQAEWLSKLRVSTLFR